jgi:hypothetical protein
LPSKARIAFDENAKDILRLLDIHGDIGGDAPGQRIGLEVLNKSAIVLITSVWEAYCEDLAAEALEHLVNNIQTGSALPKGLKNIMAKEIKADKNELAVWDLADNGWKTKAKSRLQSLTEERNRKLNTPKTTQISELFETALGLGGISASWKWKKMSISQAATKLDKFVTLRGAIAHRGAASSTVKKTEVTAYLNHVKRLVAKTGGKVNVFVKGATGKPLW